MYKYFSLLVAFFPLYLSAQKIPVIEVEDFEQYEEVRAIAKAKNHLLFIIVNDYRVPLLSNMIENGVFKNAQLANGIQKNTVACMIEITDEMGERFSSVFAIDSVPAFLFLDSTETLLAYAEGMETSASLLKTYQTAQENINLYPALQKAYVNNTLTLAQWPKLLSVYTLNRPYLEAQTLVLQYLALLSEPQLLQKEAIQYAQEYAMSLETKYPIFYLQNHTKANAVNPSFDKDLYFERAYNFNLDLAIANDDSVLLSELVTKLIPLNGLNNNSLIVLETKKLFAEETDQFNKYATATLNYALRGKDTLIDTAEFIYDEAFYLADNHGSKKSALQASKTLALESAKLSDDFRYNMLAGYVSYKLGQFDEAESLVRKAKKQTTLENNDEKADSLLSIIKKAQEEKAEAEAGVGVGKK